MTKIICEIGINHNSSLDAGKKLIDLSFLAGAWGVKFQYRKLIGKKNAGHELGFEIINEALRNNHLDVNKIIKLSKYAQSLGVHIGVSFFNFEDIKDFGKFKFDFYKVPSAIFRERKIIKKLSSFNKNLFISLGAVTENETIEIMKNYEKFLKTDKTILLHCISNYPVALLDSNLGYIDSLKKRYKNYRIGFSSHESNIYSSIYALSKKISFIERHITLDKSLKGLDHSSSSTYEEIRDLVYFAKNIRIIDNENRKRIINQGETLNLQNLGKSYYFKKNIKKGSVILEKNLILKSPKIGIDHNDLEKVDQRIMLKNGTKNQPLIRNHLTHPIRLSNKIIDFSNKYKLSIPIRMHDYKELSENIKFNNYEFHFSFKDVADFKFNKIDKNFIKNNRFTIHLPDYCDEKNLIDFFSSDTAVKKKSLQILEKCLIISKKLEKISGFDVKIICSFSSIEIENSLSFYKKIKLFITNIRKSRNILILPQWLPPLGWYFGGTHTIKHFSNPKDLKLLLDINLDICFDLSHYILSCNYYKIKDLNKCMKYKKIFKHFHLSDAKGYNGEGVNIGEGTLLEHEFTHTILTMKNIPKVLETWQGHLNQGFNFKKDIKEIYKKYA